MLGVELVQDRELKTPAKVETAHLMDEMKGNGSLFFSAYLQTCEPRTLYLARILTESS